MPRGPPVGSLKILSNQLVREAVRSLTSLAPQDALANGPTAGPSKRAGDNLDGSAAKKRKREDEQVSYTEETLPADLKKYYAQRHDLFSLYDEGIQMDREGWYSVTPEDIAAHQAERCRCDVVVDAFCGVGGNAIQLAFTCERVIAIDNDATRIACAMHNAKVYEVLDRIEFVCADVVEWLRDQVKRGNPEKVDVVFMSPPWGGVDYKAPYFMRGDRIEQSAASPAKWSTFDLDKLKPLPGKELIALARTLTPDIAAFLPRTTAPADLAAMAPDDTVEVEEAYIGQRYKGITAYFGALAGPPE